MTDDETDHEPPEREEFGHAPLSHADVRAGMTVGELAEAYGDAGIGAADLNEAIDVTAEMLADDDVTVFFSLAGAMVPAGMRAIVADLVRDGHVDALVTTGANLTHDAIEAIGGKHHHGSTGPPRRPDASSSLPPDGSREHGSERADEADLREHDERLRDEEVDRIYNVYLPQEHFALFESHLLAEV